MFEASELKVQSRFTVAAVTLKRGDEIRVDVQGEAARVDYVQLNARPPASH